MTDIKDITDLWVATSFEGEVAAEDDGAEVQEGLEDQEDQGDHDVQGDQDVQADQKDAGGEAPRPSPASSEGDDALQQHDERLSHSSSSSVVDVDARIATQNAGPPPERPRPDTHGILDKTVWRDPEAQGLREELHGGYYFPDQAADSRRLSAEVEEVPHWDQQIEPPKDLSVRMSASYIILPRLRVVSVPAGEEGDQPQQTVSAGRGPGGGFVPSIEVVEEHADEDGSMLVIKDVDRGSTSPNMQLLSPLLPGPDVSSERTSKVEFSSSLGVVIDEGETKEEEEVVDEVAVDTATAEASSAVSVVVTEAEEIKGDEPKATSSAAASDTTALQTEIEIEEEVASLMAEILEACPSAAGSAAAVRQYEVAVRAPVDEDRAKDDVLVEFTTSTGKLFSKVYKIYSNMLEVKEDLAAFFCCPVTDVALDTSVVEIDDSLPLAGAGVESHDVRLRIRVSRRPKPFLGGFRDSRSGTEFHHAESQTGPPARDTSDRVSRDAQTVRTRRRRVHTPHEKATQVPRPGLYIPGMPEHVLMADPGRYVPADEALERQRDLEDRVRTIQRYYRAYLRRRVPPAREDGEDEEAEEGEEGEEGEEVEEEQKLADEEEEQERRDQALVLAASTPSGYPRSSRDFDTLYALVERWRQAETRRLQASCSEAARRAMLGEVLEREMTLLNAIERHRQVVAGERARDRERRFLERCAEPLVFEGSNGEPIQVETLEVARAKELQAAYLSLTQQVDDGEVSLYRARTTHRTDHRPEQAPKAERLEFLVALMESLKEVGLERAEELRRLIGRECTMMARGLDAGLEPLRRHIALLFAELVKCPEVNPEATKHLRASRACKRVGTMTSPLCSLNGHVLGVQVARAADNAACTECRAFLPLEAFPLHSRSRAVGRCGGCVALQNRACARRDHRPVQYLLAAVRRAEQRAGAYSSVAFIMQPGDFKVPDQDDDDDALPLVLAAAAL
ncbi:hypothetical protein FOCC_FOCC012577 [Frankliniella occidentalis]|nr:hypothetical protein FOCC_FOCC012577 [Frankliniella occidentalis]